MAEALQQEQAVWVDGREMSRLLGISIRTLQKYRLSPDIGLIEGRHYCRINPDGSGKLTWHVDRTLDAIDAWRAAKAGVA